MNVHDTSSYGDTPIAIYGRLLSNLKKVMGRPRKHVKNRINLTLRSKFKVVSASWMYTTHSLVVIYPCAKYGRPMSNHKKNVMGRTRKHVKNPVNLTLRSKFKVVPGSWMFATHRLMVIHPCAKYCKPTRICTDRRTRQRDSYIPPELRSRGYKNS